MFRCKGITIMNIFCVGVEPFLITINLDAMLFSNVFSRD